MLSKLLCRLALGSALITGQAVADAGWTTKGDIHSLTATSFSRLVIHARFPDEISNCRDKERFYLDYGRPGTGFVHELLVAAVATGKPVQLRVTGKCELKGMSEISEARLLAE